MEKLKASQSDFLRVPDQREASTSALAPKPWLLLFLTLLTFFWLLGNRGLNETDEGRYAEIGREMIESGNWLVPHLWYVPHLDKPPVIYWAVAGSMVCFGQNEWAIRLPLALAAVSGVVATYLLALSIAGRNAAFWSALILQTSALYYLMARVVTPDMFLFQFIGWAAFCFWRGWQRLDGEDSEAKGWKPVTWFIAGWGVCALGFLTKGPIAVLVPMVGMAALLAYRWKDKPRRNAVLKLMPLGIPVFALIALPWYLLVFKTVPQSLDYMVLGQVFGHFLGTAVKNRSASPFFFFGILAMGFLPWTWLLGWLWRKKHWASLSRKEAEAWVFLGSWALFTFLLFSLSRAKLPAYILPMFLPLAILVALRFFNGTQVEVPRWLSRTVLLTPAFVTIGLPVAVFFALKVKELPWLIPQLALGLCLALILGVFSRKWSFQRCVWGAVVVTAINTTLLGFTFRTVEDDLKSSQPLKSVGQALKQEYQSGDTIVCWGAFPQGLPYYSAPLMCRTNLPYLGGTSLTKVPFEFPGNLERMNSRVLRDSDALDALLRSEAPVLVVGTQGTYAKVSRRVSPKNLRFIKQLGRWELFGNLRKKNSQ